MPANWSDAEDSWDLIAAIEAKRNEYAGWSIPDLDKPYRWVDTVPEDDEEDPQRIMEWCVN